LTSNQDNIWHIVNYRQFKSNQFEFKRYQAIAGTIDINFLLTDSKSACVIYNFHLPIILIWFIQQNIILSIYSVIDIKKVTLFVFVFTSIMLYVVITSIFLTCSFVQRPHFINSNKTSWLYSAWINLFHKNQHTQSWNWTEETLFKEN